MRESKWVSMCVALTFSVAAMAGNPDRAGSAGGTQLLINPWAQSSGWGLANSASISGVEAIFGNVAGLAYTDKTEISFTNTRYLEGADISINSIGIAQSLGGSGVLGISAMIMGFGDIELTTVEQPGGGFGTFSPTMSNIALSYGKSFSNSIYGGLGIRMFSEAIADLKTQGIAFDAGIHYVTGPADNVHFGIALRNVGPPVSFAGDGLSTSGFLLTAPEELTLAQRSESFELPSLLNIGLTYDFLLSEQHVLSVAGTYVSNSFTKDNIVIGVEYGFKEMFYVRGGYTYEDGITNDEDRTTVFTGPSAGISVELPFGSEKASDLALDYSYRATNPFDGVHSIGLRIDIK